MAVDVAGLQLVAVAVAAALCVGLAVAAASRWLSRSVDAAVSQPWDDGPTW